jgi:hypothetical protein
MVSRFCDVSRNAGLSCASAVLKAPDIPYHLPLRSGVKVRASMMIRTAAVEVTFVGFRV